MKQKNPLVPLGIRSWVAALCTRRPFHSMGVSTYAALSRVSARAFSRLPDCREVYLRGGALWDCMPAISDLDFSVVAEIRPTITEQKQSLLRWRHTYQALKRSLWVLGEVVFEMPDIHALLERSGSSHLLTENGRLKYCGGRWALQSPKPPKVAPHNRLFFSIWTYLKAQQAMTAWASGKHISFWEGRLRRLLAKVIRISEGDQTSLEANTDIPTLSAHALWALTALASQVHQETPCFDFPIEMRLETARKTPRATRVEEAIAMAAPLKCLALPGFYLADCQDPEQLTDLLSRYLQWAPGFHKQTGLVPVAISSDLYACYVKGWNNNLSWRHLVTVSSLLKSDTDFEALKGHLFQRTIESTLWQLAMLRGNLVAATVSSLRQMVSELSLNACTLETRFLTEDPGLLFDRARQSIPQAAYFTNPDEIPNTLDELIECALSLGNVARHQVRQALSCVNAVSNVPKPASPVV